MHQATFIIRINSNEQDMHWVASIFRVTIKHVKSFAATIQWVIFDDIHFFVFDHSALGQSFYSCLCPMIQCMIFFLSLLLLKLLLLLGNFFPCSSKISSIFIISLSRSLSFVYNFIKSLCQCSGVLNRIIFSYYFPLSDLSNGATNKVSNAKALIFHFGDIFTPILKVFCCSVLLRFFRSMSEGSASFRRNCSFSLNFFY